MLYNGSSLGPVSSADASSLELGAVLRLKERTEVSTAVMKHSHEYATIILLIQVGVVTDYYIKKGGNL